MKNKELLEKAIQYVRDNKTWTDAEERAALDAINHYRCSIDFASDEIYCDIHDLMEEWSSDNDMPEGWWMYYTTEDDIFFAL